MQLIADTEVTMTLVGQFSNSNEFMHKLDIIKNRHLLTATTDKPLSQSLFDTGCMLYMLGLTLAQHNPKLRTIIGAKTVNIYTLVFG
jgi:hypothetical protein